MSEPMHTSIVQRSIVFTFLAFSNIYLYKVHKLFVESFGIQKTPMVVVINTDDKQYQLLLINS